jgi:hypothetical protein
MQIETPEADVTEGFASRVGSATIVVTRGHGGRAECLAEAVARR